MRHSYSNLFYFQTYFNPHTCEGCDCKRDSRTSRWPKFQSTHPRRVRLETDMPFFQSTIISIHTPAKGATVAVFVEDARPHYISIHTPAKGATWLILTRPSSHVDFNPHTREGCDAKRFRYSFSSKKFQSTHPRRVRPSRYDVEALQEIISIHTPAKGATTISIEEC